VAQLIVLGEPTFKGESQYVSSQEDAVTCSAKNLGSMLPVENNFGGHDHGSLCTVHPFLNPIPISITPR